MEYSLALWLSVSYVWGGALEVGAGPIVTAARDWRDYAELEPCSAYATVDDELSFELRSEARLNKALKESR